MLDRAKRTMPRRMFSQHGKKSGKVVVYILRDSEMFQQKVMKPNPSKKCRKNAVIVYSSLLQILKWKNILVQIIRIMTQYIRFSLLALVVPPFHPLGILLYIDYLEEMNIDSHGGPRESEISNS